SPPFWTGIAAIYGFARESLKRAEVLERSLPISDILDRAGAQRSTFLRAITVAPVQAHEAVGIGVGDGIEQHRLHHAENSGVGPDAEREREHGYGSEAGVLPQLAEGVAKVIKHSKGGSSEFRDVMEGFELRRIPARPST